MKFTPLMGVVLAATMITPLATTMAHAEMGARAAERFAEEDTNGDGVLSIDEAQARAVLHFEEADSDGNGTLSEDEMSAMHQEHRAARQEARHEGRHDGRHEERFALISGDDGLVNLAEFQAGAMHRFEGADLDENGSVTETEMRLVMQARHGGGRHGGPEAD